LNGDHRRPKQEKLVAGSERVFPVRRLAADGLEAWEQGLAAEYEGYVAKDEASVYPGGRTRCWLKVKHPGWMLSGGRWHRLPLRK
jgi:ATP-dependent DNA ligase